MPQTKDISGPKPGETVADHKSRVMEAVKAHTEAQKVAARATNDRPPAGFPASPATQPQIPGFMQDMGVDLIPPPPASVPPPNPATGAPAGQAPSTNGTPMPEWERMAKERGWKTPEDAIRSYTALEREFHAKNRQLIEQQRQQQPPVPAYVPPAPAYQPPPVQWQQPVSVVQQLARRHGISVEDAERLLPFVADVSRALTEEAVLSERQRYEPVIVDLNNKVRRNEEIMDIAQDPAMRVPRVQYEIQKIFTENPSIFRSEPQPLRWALDRALRNIAQESLGAYQMPPGTSEHGLPSTPPVTAGSGTGAAGRGTGMPEPNVDLAGTYFKLESAAEKRKFLEQMGVVAV